MRQLLKPLNVLGKSQLQIQDGAKQILQLILHLQAMQTIQERSNPVFNHYALTLQATSTNRIWMA